MTQEYLISDTCIAAVEDTDHIREKVIAASIWVLDKSSLKSLLQQIIFVDNDEVCDMFKLMFEIFFNELDPLLLEYCSINNMMVMDSPYIAKYISISTEYVNPSLQVDYHIWESSDIYELSYCDTSLLRHMLTSRFGAYVNTFPRSFLLRQLCGCSTIHDNDLLQRIRNEIYKLTI